MDYLENCPHCKASMIDQSHTIPEERQCDESCGILWEDRDVNCRRNHFYGKDAHFYRSITVEVRGVYDGGLYVQCPDCDGKWHRWPEGHPLRAKAALYI